MEFLNRKAFLTSLRTKYPGATGGYFWDALSGLKGFGIQIRASRQRLEAATLGLARVFRMKEQILIFTDHMAGWSGVSKRRQHSPVSVANLQEGLSLLRQHGHFRDKEGFVDNYYFCDDSLSWFVVFCHENDWHLFIAESLCGPQKFGSWIREHKVRADCC